MERREKRSGKGKVPVPGGSAVPGELYDRMAQAGRLLQPDAWETCTLFDVNYQPEGMSVSELETGFRDLTRRIYDSDFIESRRRRFFMRQSELRRLRAT